MAASGKHLVAIALGSLAGWATHEYQPVRLSRPQAVLAPGDLRAAREPSVMLLDESPVEVTQFVAFATNRDQSSATASPGQLQYGRCRVVLPVQRQRGEWRSDVAGPTRDRAEITCRNTEFLSPTDYRTWLNELVSRAPRRDVLVFVHGYNVDFSGAVCRAAQLSRDVPFNGVVVAYCWPSQAETLRYDRDARTVSYGPWSLVQFLARLRQDLAADVRIHILAHSMGNRVVLDALLALAGERPAQHVRSNVTWIDPAPLCPEFGTWRAGGAQPPPLDNVVFAAPDVAADIFRNSLPRVRGLMRTATLYASSRDVALWASAVRNLHRRAGDARDVVTAAELVTVDASAALGGDAWGHSYYGSSPAVLDDLFCVLALNQAPVDRPK